MFLNCDTEGCRYVQRIFGDENILARGVAKRLLTEIEAHKDDACPRCGSRLLSEDDYKVTVLFIKITTSWPVRLINWIGGKLGGKKMRTRVGVKDARLHVEHEEIG
jgi:hypothetical protein